MFFLRRYSTLNVVIILNFKATSVMCCYGQLVNNLMQLDLSTFVLNLFSSVRSFQSCPCLCNAMYCSMPGFPIRHQLLELTQAHVHRLGDAIQPSHPVFTYSSCFQTFLISGSFPISQLFLSGGQIIGAQLQHQFFQ